MYGLKFEAELACIHGSILTAPSHTYQLPIVNLTANQLAESYNYQQHHHLSHEQPNQQYDQRNDHLNATSALVRKHSRPSKHVQSVCLPESREMCSNHENDDFTQDCLDSETDDSTDDESYVDTDEHDPVFFTGYSPMTERPHWHEGFERVDLEKCGYDYITYIVEC